MKKENTTLIVAIVLGALLLGIVAIQFFWVENSLELKKKDFDSKMTGILERVAIELEDIEIRDLIEQEPKLKRTGTSRLRKPSATKKREAGQNIDSALLDRVMFGLREKRKLEDRISVHLIDSLLSSLVFEKRAFINYKWAISSDELDDWIPTKLNPEKGSTLYRTKLFPSDPINSNNYLILAVEDVSAIVLKSNLWLLGVVAVFTIVVVIGFWFFVNVLLRHKKIGEMKDDFINNLTHEFKTPLTTIAFAADSLRTEGAIKDVNIIRQLSGTIKRETFRMNDQVEKVLQMAMANSDQLQREAVDLSQIIREVISSFQMILKRKNGLIEYHQTDSLLAEVDELQVNQVIRNLIDNAIKYCKRAPRISVSSWYNDDHVFIEIADNGIGMDKKVRTQIFDSFFRFKEENLYDTPGFGLGLSFVRSVMMSHGGEVSVTSKVGFGSRFKLRFNKMKSS